MKKYGCGVAAEFLERLVTEVVSARSPEKAGLLENLGARSLSSIQCEELRGVLVEELTENGLGADDEPNEFGYLIEAAMSWLGQACAEREKKP